MNIENQKEIVVAIATNQIEPSGESSETQMIIPAISGTSEGVQVLIYDIEDTLNVLMITDNYVKLVKSGDVEADMTFAVGRKTEAVFSAAGKKLVFEAYTKKCETKKDGSILDINYMLFADGQMISEYELKITEF